MKSIAIIALIILGSVLLLYAAEETIQVADFTLPDFEGNEVTLSELEGLIVLDFWATWCPPCREEVPVLQRLYDDYQDQGLTIIGISTEDITTQKRFKETMNEIDVAMDYILLVDKERSAFSEYGIQGIPTTIFVGDNLREIYREVGFTIEYEAKFRDIIEANLPD